MNPTLTHVFYATKPYFEGENMVRLYRLWDIQQEQIIWESPTDFLISSLEIVWAYDGSTIAFTGRYRTETTPNFQMYELYILSNDGQFKKMGAFADKFLRFSIHGLSWSPNSNKLFFSFADETTMNTDVIATYPVPKPLVLELESGEIYNFCLEGSRSRQPWSPDSTLLAFISLFDQQEHLIILNVETGDVYITPFDICIAPDCEPSEDIGLTHVWGWMSN